MYKERHPQVKERAAGRFRRPEKQEGTEKDGQDYIHGGGQHGVRPQRSRRLHVPRGAEGFPLRAVRHRRTAAEGVGIHPEDPECEHQRQSRHHHVAPRRREPQGGAARRRFRGQRDSGRRLRALDRDRFRDSEEVRPAPDHRRHARHRRYFPGAAHDSGHARFRPRHRRGCARTPGS